LTISTKNVGVFFFFEKVGTGSIKPYKKSECSTLNKGGDLHNWGHKALARALGEVVPQESGVD
jgi:hypothetical protein